MEYSEQHPSNPVVDRQGEEAAPLPDYDPLALTIVSVMLEHDGEMLFSNLYERMRDKGIQRNRVRACIGSTLLKEGMLAVDNVKSLQALERGVDYVDAHLERLDEAEAEALITKKARTQKVVAQRAAEGGKPLSDVLLETATAMSKEINHMREALGEPPEDFGYLESAEADKLSGIVAQLTSNMKLLEKRLSP